MHLCLHNGLRLLHPFMPFVTEELYHRLALLCGQPRTTIMNAAYPEPAPLAALRSKPAEDAMESIFKISGAIRQLRAAYLRGPLEKHAPVVYLVCRRAADAALVT